MSQGLYALSPLDGRYAAKVSELQSYCSESALIRYRIHVEVEWLIQLCSGVLPDVRELTHAEKDWLRTLALNLTHEDFEAVKTIEKTTNHDVKAVEYFLKEKMSTHLTKDLQEKVHFACTSEDINNLAYGLMLKQSIHLVILPMIGALEEALNVLAGKGKNTAMLSHTHGQPASPTTVGKEIINVKKRLERQREGLSHQNFYGKINGAVGNWNAHVVAYPEVNWEKLSKEFVTGLGLSFLSYTTQIEPHDYIAELSHQLIRINTILIDLDRDLWSYISHHYFIQKLKEGEVGSSTMPHKVNPIDFENSEGNLGLANAILGHFAEKLPLSRMQRDLTDSTVLRNVGVGLGYSLLGYRSLLQGLFKIELNDQRLGEDLNEHWEVLGEAVQTVMRRYNIDQPYEKLKALTRGKKLTSEDYQAFIKTLEIPEDDKNRLLKLTPDTYIGLAVQLVEQALETN
ncbi:MAG: hypothetical protein ACD_28C00216G0004 [uncultured bacterium]|nr:MAG: hypothetical protein ACD_28C00216G0004 [uncultured bacterium]KKT73505.1 MAG: Adenylosuccinate lyase [Candidatus Peregrinibacteria bacterium GW2011_GWA2_44_7]